jgi:Transposase DNA-binding
MQTNKAVAKSGKIANDSIVGTWIEDEVGGCNFKDVRLARRFSKLLGMMSDGIGESVPYACQDWANTKAAYRFFSNDTVSEE